MLNQPSSLSSKCRVLRIHNRVAGFTLVEILLASAMSAMVLLAIYGVFTRAIKLRDQATERIRYQAVRSRAVDVIRNDLRNALFSGGILAASLSASKQNQMSRFPGYLRFTTTTGKDSENSGDVQQVEYYIAEQGGSAEYDSGDDSAQPVRDQGVLVRAVTQDLLSSGTSRQESILSRVESFETSFFDGNTWQPEWVMSGTGAVLPQAIRINIQQGSSPTQAASPPPVEVLVPWTTGTYQVSQQ